MFLPETWREAGMLRAINTCQGEFLPFLTVEFDKGKTNTSNVATIDDMLFLMQRKNMQWHCSESGSVVTFYVGMC